MSEVRNPKPEAEVKKNPLLDNAMNLEPIAVVYQMRSELLEKTVLRWLESHGINTKSIMIRALLKDDWKGATTLAKAANSTNLPFLVVLFKQMVEDDDFNVEGGLSAATMKNLRSGLNNLRDFSQLHMRENTPLNKLLTSFNGGSRIQWNLQKKKKTAYTVLDSDSVIAMCFKIPKNEISNFQFDILNRPQSKFNPDTRRKEFVLKFAYSRVPSKRRPMQDPLNDIR